MREKFTERPRETWLEVLVEKPGMACTVHLSENIQTVEETGEDGQKVTTYEADTYTVDTQYREGLLESVEKNRDIWLNAAKKEATDQINKTLAERVELLENMTEDLTLAILGA